MAEGVKALWNRPYFDKSRVGIYGTSYGGYAAVMSILRHPEVFAAASASSPVTAWYHYDSIYTERYMWIPQENKENYEKGSAMTYAKDLKGRLLLYYGTADNNVHPSNMMQLIKALQDSGKSFDVQVGTGPRPRWRQPGTDDGVLHRELGRPPVARHADVLTWARGRLLRQTSSRHPQGARCRWPTATFPSGQGFEQPVAANPTLSSAIERPSRSDVAPGVFAGNCQPRCWPRGLRGRNRVTPSVAHLNTARSGARVPARSPAHLYPVV